MMNYMDIYLFCTRKNNGDTLAFHKVRKKCEISKIIRLRL